MAVSDPRARWAAWCGVVHGPRHRAPFRVVGNSLYEDTPLDMIADGVIGGAAAAGGWLR